MFLRERAACDWSVTVCCMTATDEVKVELSAEEVLDAMEEVLWNFLDSGNCSYVSGIRMGLRLSKYDLDEVGSEATDIVMAVLSDLIDAVDDDDYELEELRELERRLCSEAQSGDGIEV